ncbi:MAG: hypothetical protein AAGJ10_14870 [Bacteroidota bacterium]
MKSTLGLLLLLILGSDLASVHAQPWKDRGGIYVFYARQPQSTLAWPQLNAMLDSKRPFFARFADPDVREEVIEDADGEIVVLEFPGGTLLPRMQFDHDFSLGVGLIIASLNAELSWHSLHGISKARLKQGITQTYEVKGRTSRLDVGILAPLGALELGWFMGMHSARGEVRSFRTYPDGTESYGDEAGFSGIWTVNSLDLTAGFKAMIRLGPVAVYGRAEWVDPFNFSEQFTTIPTALTQNTYRGSGVRANSDIYTFVEFLPARSEDFGKSILINDEPVVDDHFSGFTLHVGVALVLGG